MIFAVVLVLLMGGYANAVHHEATRCRPGDQWLERCQGVPVDGHSGRWGGFDAR